MGNVTTIQRLKHGQLIANIPKSLAEAIGWQKGDKIYWWISGNNIIVEKKF